METTEQTKPEAKPLEPPKYRNGRVAKEKDIAINLSTGQSGTLNRLTPQNSTSNGRLHPITFGSASVPAASEDPFVTVSECVHLDDIREAFKAPAK